MINESDGRGVVDLLLDVCVFHMGTKTFEGKECRIKLKEIDVLLGLVRSPLACSLSLVVDSMHPNVKQHLLYRGNECHAL